VLTVRARGVRLGIDVGAVRVGVAASDPGGILASPLVTLRRDAESDSDIAEIARLVTEREAVEVIVGLPRTLAGRRGPAALAAEAYAARLSCQVVPIPVRLHDERLTTVIASRALADRGVRGKRQRAVVDQAAAVAILQSWLDAERSGDGRP
jgi:putative Holliday junction resolvase